MTLKRPFIAAVVLILSSACWRAEAEVSRTSPYLPTISTDFSDLDARDAQNKPLKSASAIGELLTLFQENAFVLVLQQAPPAMRFMQDLVTSFSHLFKGLFLKSIDYGCRAFEQAFMRSIRRVVHNVHNLWITLSVDSWTQTTSLGPLTLSRKPQKLYLRC